MAPSTITRLFVFLRALPERVQQKPLARYLFAIAVVAAAFLLRVGVAPLTGTGAPFFLFFGATLVTSLVAGTGPGLAVLAVSLPVAAYMFVIRAGYSVSEAAVQVLLYAADGVLIVYLTSRVNKAHRMVQSVNQELRTANQRITAVASHTREIIELAPDAFFLGDLDGRIVDVNDAACKMLGYARDELVGKTLYDITPFEDAARIERVKSELLTPGKVNRAEWVQIRKDGTTLPVEVSSNILPGGRWQAFVRDITRRKRLEDERQVFVSLLDNSSDFIGIADPDGKPIYLNPAGRSMVGLPLDYPIEKTEIRQYYAPDQQSFAIDVILKTMLERGRWAGETRFWNWKTEEPITVSDEHFMVRDASGKRILGMATITRNISEAKRIHDQLRESEERFRLALDEAPIGMALVALDGRFVRVNRALCEIVGYDEAELIGLTFRAITHPDDLDKDAPLTGQLFRGEIPSFQLAKRYLRKNRTIVEVMIHVSMVRAGDGSPLYYITQTEDVTDRNRAEAELRLSEAKFSGIIDISADAIISVDDQQRIVLFNEGAEKIFGYTRDEISGARLDVLIPERFRAVHREHVSGFARGLPTSRRIGEHGATIAGMRKNGEEFPADAAISKLEVGDSTVLTVALRDITEQQRREKEIQRAVQMRDQVLGVVAHDLRNPLNTIVLLVSALQGRGSRFEPRDLERLERISRAADRMDRLIGDLLDVALLEAGKMTMRRAYLPAPELLAEAVEMQRALATAADIDVQLEISRDVRDVLGDHHRLLQVFENLIGNAIKFTCAGGRIKVGAVARDGEVLFWVADTGQGIAAENLPHVFDRFWQAVARYRGLGAGLGLPITKGIVEAHGGHIWVESIPGKGTTFYFSIPSGSRREEHQPHFIH
jgi:PAS domain S-box-containing protein